MNSTTFPRGEQIFGAVADAISRMHAESLAVRPRVDTDAILRTVTSTIAERLPVTCIAVLMKADLETLRVVHADVTNPGMNEFLDRYNARMLSADEVPSHGLSRRVIETGGSVLIPRMTVEQLQNMASSEAQEYAAAAGMPIKVEHAGVLMVPMRVGPGIIGTLSLFDWGAHGTLQEADLDWMQRAADHVGIAIDDALMRNRAVDRAERMSALSEVALAISSGQELRVTFKLILDQVVATLHVDAADVLIIEDDERAISVAASTGFRSGASAAGMMPSESGKRWIIEHNIGTPATIDWLGQSRRWILAREGLSSYTAAPIIIRENFAGVLEVFSRQRLEPDPEWLSFLDAMATQAAIALDNARLREPRRAGGHLTPRPDLTEREMEILGMVVDGASNREVANKLHLSENTIKFHVRQLLEKAEVANRTELATRAVQSGWV